MKKSFSLVEVLIAIIIFSMLISTSMYVFSFLSSNLENYKFIAMNKAVRYSYINKSIKGINYYIINSKEYFFKKNQNSFEYITSTPILSDNMSIVKIEFINNKIFYYEEELFTKNANYKNPEITKNSIKIEILNNINSVEFNFKYKENFEIPDYINFNILYEDGKKELWEFNINSNFNDNIKFIKFKGGLQ